MYILILVYVALLGAIMGSFVTALVHRQRTGQSMWHKHSQCPHCRHDLSVLDLIPIVSYGLRRGQCHYCHKPIGRGYVLTELASVVLYVLLFDLTWRHFVVSDGVDWWWLGAVMVFVWLMASLLLALSVYDLRWSELPNPWTIGGASLSLIMLIVAGLLDKPLLWQPQVVGISTEWWGGIISGLLAGLAFIAIIYGSEVILKKPGMGMGDAKLAVLMGFYLGFPAIVVSLYVAFIFGAVLSLLLIAGRRKSFGTSLPFGPFMIAGLLVSLWISPPIIEWYSTFWL